MTTFEPDLAGLPSAQKALWPELGATPSHFVLYGGTALAIRLGHRASVDFDFFSNRSFDPGHLAGTIPYLRGTEQVRVAPNTLTCRVERGGPVLISYFGGLGLGRVAPYDRAAGTGLRVASLLDIAATKMAVVQRRAEAKDYVDVDALIRHGVALASALAAGGIVHGRGFNSLMTLKALSYFGDVPGLAVEVQQRLTAAVKAVDLTRLPKLEEYCDPEDAGGDV